ncbi:MAG TPA: hypothetical protein PLH37_01505 [bacterium]|nr:hypothetical protein [bacterium]
MNFYIKQLRIAEKVLLAALFIFVIECTLPHSLLAAELYKTNTDGPVQYILTSTKNVSENLNPTLPTSLEKKPRIVRYITATAYSSTVDQCDDTPFITANGSHVRDGIIAANFLPFGTKVKIPELYGDKIFSVEDRMNSKYHYRIDVWMPDRESAIIFGSKYIKIEIY